MLESVLKLAPTVLTKFGAVKFRSQTNLLNFYNCFFAGVLVSIFECLHDGDVISDDAFFAWEACEDVAESEGKGVAISSTIKFFTLLCEVEDESDEENDN